MSLPAALQSLLDPWFAFFADDIQLFLVQLTMLAIGVLAIFLIFYATRDILLRTNSFFYMFFSIVLVAVMPILGFLLYLLIRPPRTNRERELEAVIREIHENTQKKTTKRKTTTRRKKTTAPAASVKKAVAPSSSTASSANATSTAA